MENNSLSLPTRKLGYKITRDGKCRGVTYRVGETHRLNGFIVPCKWGYHYCKKIDDLFNYYAYQKGVTEIFEVEDVGDQSIECDDKVATNGLRILRSIPVSEWNSIMSRRKFDENGNIIFFRGAGVNWTEYHYNSFGDIIETKEYNGYWCKTTYQPNRLKTGTVNSSGFRQNWKYNKVGKQLSYKDSNGHWSKYKYDRKGRIVQEQNSNGVVYKWVYDKDGNISSAR